MRRSQQKAILIDHQIQNDAGLHVWQLSGILLRVHRRHFRDDDVTLSTRIDMARKKQRLDVTDGSAGPLIRAGWQPGSIFQQLVRA